MGHLQLPDDLPGGWDHPAPFRRVPLSAGQVWRKSGPIGALKIEGLLYPGQPDYDGGLQGVSVVRSVALCDRIVWGRRGGFLPGNEDLVLRYLEASGYSLAPPEEEKVSYEQEHRR